MRRYDKEYLDKISTFPKEYNLKILAELQTRLKKLWDYKDLTSLFYHDVADLDAELIVNTKMKIESLEQVKCALELALDVIQNIPEWEMNPEYIKEAFLEWIAEKDMKNGQVLWPVRVALSMQQFSPWALELIYIFGKEMSIERIQKTLKQI